MKLKLSVVDQSSIHINGSVTNAPHFSTHMDKVSEQWGFRRYWIAEYHNTPSYTSPYTETMAV